MICPIAPERVRRYNLPVVFGNFKPDKTLFLIDISSFIFRAFYAIRALTNRKGEPTNAIYGVASMLKKLIDEADPKHLAVVFDSKEPSVRKEVYAEYKANRSAPPEELLPQFDRIETLTALMGIRRLRKSTIEADDLIATLCRVWTDEAPDHQAVVVTGDKDLMQLVGPRVCLWDTMKGLVIHAPEVHAKLGVQPEQVRDYLALVGDSSDNVPGVPSFGPKGAADVLKQFGTLEAAIAAAKSKQWTGKKADALLEHEAMAHLSARLVELDRHVPLEGVAKARDEFQYKFTFGSELKTFLQEMDFQTLASKWEQELTPKTEKSVPTSDSKFVSVQTKEAFEAMVKRLISSAEFGFDIETTSLNPREAKLVGLSLCCEDDRAYYVPVGHRDQAGQLDAAWVIERIRPLIENPKLKKIGQNLKYDWSVLSEQRWLPDGIGADTMVAAYVLDPSGRHNLDALSKKYLDYTPVSFEEVCGKGKSAITFDQVSIEVATRYAAEDAWCAWRLWRVLKPELEKQGLMHVFAEVDMPLVPVLSRMERAGVCLDLDWLAQLSTTFGNELATIESKIAKFSKKEINLNSPKQLAELLFEELLLPTQSKTKTGYSTDSTVLEALAPLHEVPRLLMEYREIPSNVQLPYIAVLMPYLTQREGTLIAFRVDWRRC